MFSRKPQTAMTTKKNVQRNHNHNLNENKPVRFIPSVQPTTGYVNVNGTLMPF